jgi:transposase-like protein
MTVRRLLGLSVVKAKSVVLGLANEQTSSRVLRHIEKYTRPRTTCYSDEWQGYNNLPRRHYCVSHSEKEWARDDDGDGIREVHTNSIEGLWTSLRNFLRPFRGVHKSI